jgi:hypothetical protein
MRIVLVPLQRHSSRHTPEYQQGCIGT